MNLRKRALSMLLSASMICNMGVTPVFAYTATGDKSIGASSICEHHLEHTTECGYTEGTAGAPCTHTHTADCYSTELICGLTEEVVDSGSSSDAAHTHTQECYKLVCAHVHDTACGYMEETAGTPCTYECLICNPKDTLPPDPMAANAATAKANKGTDAITIKINDVVTEYGGATLQAAVTTSGVTPTSITKLTITKGEVTAADWQYFAGGTPGTTTSPFTALTDFTVDAAVTAVADIPNGGTDTPVFPKTIVNVTIPKATTIGNFAFFGCTSLITASIPQVTNIGMGAFDGCAKLTTANFPVATNIGMSAFFGCKNLASTSFPVAITIGDNVFSGCSALTSATFPLVKDIGSYAFSFCVALATASFPEAETIGMEAFSECRKLTTASFPKAIVIGSSAFGNCVALTTASFPGVTNIMSGAFNSCRNLTSTSFPVATLIQDNAFYFCAALTTVSFPIATTIGNNVFNGCTALTELKLGATPPTVGIDAFKNCPSTRNLVLVDTDGTTPLTGGALTTAQTNYDAVTADGGNTTDKLWYGWTISTPVVADAITIKINDAVTEYGGATLEAAVTASGVAPTSITKLTITKGEVTAADWTWFKGNGTPVLSALTDFTVDAAVTAVADIPAGGYDKPIFQKTIVNVTIPKATTIGNFAFYGCEKLEATSFPVATTIGEGAFYNCSVLVELKLGATVPTVGTDAFTGCYPSRSLVFVDAEGTLLADGALTTAQANYKVADDGNTDDNDKRWYGWTIPTPVVADAITIKINDVAAEYGGATLQAAVTASGTVASAITKLTITKGEVTAADWTWFKGSGRPVLSALTDFTVDAAVTAVADIPNGGWTMPIFPFTIKTVNIPKATTVGNYAFFGCAIKTASFPQATNIGMFAFDGCRNLSSTSFPVAITIGGDAFSDCSALTTATFPAATIISDSAFDGCAALTTANFPQATTIGNFAFYNCTALTELKLGATPPTVSANVFENCPTTRNLVLVDANGTVLTGTALTNAQTEYDKVVSPDTGTATDGFWYGWKVREPIPDKITITVSDGTTPKNAGGASLSDAITNSALAVNTIKTLTVTGGEVTTADWIYFAGGTPGTTTSPFTALTDFTVDATVTAVADIPNGDYDKPLFPKTIVNVTIPNVIKIGDYAFFDCTALTTASFPVATSIGDSAFNGCAKLTTESFPMATTIGNYAFCSCAMKTASFPKLTSIGVSVFSSCDALTSATFPLVKDIGSYAFSNCDVLTTASFPVATSIGDDAFSSCTALTTVDFPVAITIGDNAFYHCAALTSTSFPVATTIGRSVFSSCAALTTVSFPHAISIGDGAFYYCTALAELKLGATVPITVGTNAFQGCPSTRILVLVDANGTQIVDGALTTAQAAYDAAEGDTTDKLWYGWKLIPQQAKPTATIDYLTASLTGLVDGAAYSITVGGVATDKTAQSGGTLAIDADWFGKTISIVKKGDGTTTADSTAQSLAIPAKPSTPTTALQIAKTKDSIAITNTASYTGCEFSKDSSAWNSTGIFGGLTQATAYIISVRVKAVKNTSFASGSKSVSVTTIAADGSTSLKPNESIPTGDGAGTITNDGDKVTIDKDKNPSTPNTVITPPSGGDVTVKDDGTVTVPPNGAITTGNGSTVTLPSGGTADKDGNVSGGTNGSIIIGDNTITPPAGGTITTDKDGKTELPGGSTIVNGDTTVTIDGGTSGGSVDKDGNITLPSNGEITVTDNAGNTSTIKVPAAGGDVTIKNDGTVSAPSGSTVTPPDGKPSVTVPEGGGTVGGDGGITSNSTVTLVAVSPATVSIQVGNTQQLTATVTGTNSPVQTVTWTSSNPAAVTVNASGLVTAVASGTAIITAVSTLDTSKSGTVAVTVTSPSSGGSTDDDSDDSSGGTVITPPATQDKPTPPTTVETGVKVKTDKNGNATATVPSKEVTNAIEKAQKEAKKNGTEKNGIAIVLNVNVKENANSLEITLSEASIIALRNAKVTQLTINNSFTTMTFDLAALNALQGGDVKLIISEVDVKSLSAEAQKAIGNRPVFSFKVRVGGKVVTDFKGGRIGLQMPYTHTTTELAGNLCGVFVDTKGKVTWLENSSYDAITRTSLTSTTHLSVYGVGYKKNVPKFNDIKKHWAKNDIDFVVARGLLTGTGKTNFAPDQSITRGMFVTALGRLAGVNSKKYQSTTFTDVKKDAYYAPYVNWATKKGITSGTTATTFSPEKTVSRQEMAVFMTNYAKATGYTVPKTRSSITFSDNASIASWAKESVKSMQMAGVIMSKDGNRFDPNGIATRAEVSAVLRRYVELVIDRTTAQGFDLNDSGKIVYYEKGKLLPFFFYNL